MISYESVVLVSRTPSDVWPYLVERDKQALWSDVPMEPLTEGPLTPGSQILVRFGKGPLHISLTLEFTALERDTLMAFTTVSKGGVHWEGEYRLAAAPNDGTRLSQHGELRFHGLWRLIEPLVGKEIKQGEIAELERLKVAAERSA